LYKTVNIHYSSYKKNNPVCYFIKWTTQNLKNIQANIFGKILVEILNSLAGKAGITYFFPGAKSVNGTAAASV
jgi:hypothetical protein